MYGLTGRAGVSNIHVCGWTINWTASSDRHVYCLCFQTASFNKHVDRVRQVDNVEFSRQRLNSCPWPHLSRSGPHVMPRQGSDALILPMRIDEKDWTRIKWYKMLQDVNIWKHMRDSPSIWLTNWVMFLPHEGWKLVCSASGFLRKVNQAYWRLNWKQFKFCIQT